MIVDKYAVLADMTPSHRVNIDADRHIMTFLADDMSIAIVVVNGSSVQKMALSREAACALLSVLDATIFAGGES